MCQEDQKCIITDISWERIFLHLTVFNNTGHELVLEYNKKKVKIPCKKIDDDIYEYVINTVAVENRSFLPNGSWKMGYWDLGVVPDPKTGKLVEMHVIYPCAISDSVAYNLENLDKIFRYGNSKYAYTVSFEPYTSLLDQDLHVYIHSRFMKQNERWYKRNPFGEAIGIISFFKRYRLHMAKKVIRLLFSIINLFTPKKANRILFMSETKDILWGNILAIDSRLKERKLTDMFSIEYSFRKSVGHNQSLYSWLATLRKIARADFIFVDDYSPIFSFIKLRPNVKLIQVWHAGIGFKAVGYCRFGKKGSPYPLESCHKKYTYALAGSDEMVKVFEEVFGIESKAILPIGIPRMDDFLDPEHIKTFKDTFYAQHPELKEKKIILFAPTYRGVGQKDAYYDYAELDLNALYDFCGDEYIVLIKMHPFILEKPSISGFEDRIVDFSDFPEINNLYYITDILITDYSSSYYEYSLLERPILFFTPDRTVYEVSRGVHQYVKDSAPGKVCDTFDELLGALRNKDFELEKTKKFVKDNFGDYDSNATDRLIDTILLSGRVEKDGDNHG